MDDAYLLPDCVLESYRFMRAPWRTERVDSAPHFMMLDRPDHITGLLIDYFRNGPHPVGLNRSRDRQDERPLGWCCNRL